MRRGFKSEAESRSATARRALKLAAHAPLNPWQYAASRGVVVLDIKDLGLDSATLRHLTVTDPSSWSAMSLKDGDQFAIVINPAHVPWRQNNDLMHELAHIDLNHLPARVDVSPNGLLLLSDYSDEQEVEADWLAAALLVPREGLMLLRRQQKNVTEIASFFSVSNQLCEWRLRMTGVDTQIRRAMNR